MMKTTPCSPSSTPVEQSEPSLGSKISAPLETADDVLFQTELKVLQDALDKSAAHIAAKRRLNATHKNDSIVAAIKKLEDSKTALSSKKADFFLHKAEELASAGPAARENIITTTLAPLEQEEKKFDEEIAAQEAQRVIADDDFEKLKKTLRQACFDITEGETEGEKSHRLGTLLQTSQLVRQNVETFQQQLIDRLPSPVRPSISSEPRVESFPPKQNSNAQQCNNELNSDDGEMEDSNFSAFSPASPAKGRVGKPKGYKKDKVQAVKDLVNRWLNNNYEYITRLFASAKGSKVLPDQWQVSEGRKR